ncbi:hypothetical protein J3R30DRAFT_3636582 [Lentinula aciculospora]|uniref:Uncharacterized protein n=1 Tax=Lentinula aciculospora TaxID=153920 RepID=A0A9W8ZR32_9AGAR|nr:hypothetical protein J3R30DRAFT_3636582 [Lentinula aciculospora]
MSVMIFVACPLSAWPLGQRLLASLRAVAPFRHVEPTDVDLVGNLVRRQGEELLRVRKELEEFKKLHTTAINAVSLSKMRMEDVLRRSSHWQLRLTTIKLDLAKLRSEYETVLGELEAACGELRNTLGPGERTATMGAAELPTSNTEDTGATGTEMPGESLNGFSGIFFGDVLSIFPPMKDAHLIKFLRCLVLNMYIMPLLES